MRITSSSQPYAVVVQQTPNQYHADGNIGFPEKFVLEYFDDYDFAREYFVEMLRDHLEELIADYTEGIIDIYSYSPTSGDSCLDSVWFYEDGTIEDHGIRTATEYGLL